jgi:hypothetical protein
MSESKICIFSCVIFVFIQGYSLTINNYYYCTYREIAEDEVTHLFAASDDDQDEMLSYDEILEHHDTFVGSEATDFGDHLHNLDKFKDEL